MILCKTFITNFLIQIICVTIIAQQYIALADESLSKRNLIPLNYIDALNQFHQRNYHSLELHENSDYFYDYKTSDVNLLSEMNRIVNEFSNASKRHPNVTKPCYLQIGIFADGLAQRKKWAIDVVDAFGKPTSGILQGSFVWTGEYSECMNSSSVIDNWQGKYCTLANPVPPAMSSVELVYGVCMPQKCTDDDVAHLINFFLENTLLNISKILPMKLPLINSSYVICQEPKAFYNSSIFAIVFLAVLLLIIVFGTVYDLFKKHSIYVKSNLIMDTKIMVVENNEEKVLNIDDRIRLIEHQEDEIEPMGLKILRSFSAYTNSKKVFNINTTEEQLQCLHAIRFLSLAWVILGHTYAFRLSNNDNSLIISDWFKRISFLTVSNAFFSVDSFFMLSGLLTSYIFLKEVDKTKKKLTIKFMIKYYLHRLWRLTPPYMIVLMFSALLTRNLGSGPFYPIDGFEINMCKDTWWTNLLYINNFVKANETCLSVSWYLANDMQFHWIAPIMLIPFVYGKKFLGFFISGVLLIGCFISIGLTLNAFPGSEMGILNTGQDFFLRVYIKPWARIGPFIIGIIVGYLIYAEKKRLIQFKMSKSLNIVGWILSVALLMALVYGIYPDFNNSLLSKTTHIIYQTFSRTAWAIGLGFIIFSCVTSNGGFINKILSLSIWTPLSRLTYAAYLLHLTFIYYIYGIEEHPAHLQDQNMVYYYIGHLVFSYVIAFFVSICFEIPLIGLEKFVFKRN